MNFYQVPLEGVQILTGEQAALLAGQLNSPQPAMLQINNPPIPPINVDQSYYVSVNGELYYPVAASDISGSLAVVPLDQQMDWVAVPVDQQQFAPQQLPPEVQIQPFPSSSGYGTIPTTSAASSVGIQRKKRQTKSLTTPDSKKIYIETSPKSTPSPTMDEPSSGNISATLNDSPDRPRKLLNEEFKRKIQQAYENCLSSSNESFLEFRMKIQNPRRIKQTKRFKRPLLSDRCKKPVEEEEKELLEEDFQELNELMDRAEQMLDERSNVSSVIGNTTDDSNILEEMDEKEKVEKEDSVQIVSDNEVGDDDTDDVHERYEKEKLKLESPEELNVEEDEEEFTNEERSDSENVAREKYGEGSDSGDDEEEEQFLEYFTDLIASLENEPRMSFPDRLWNSKPIISVLDSMPKLDYQAFYQLVNQVILPVVTVIPNAIINGVGPTVHECGSLFNFLINENVTAPEKVWFHFSMSVLIGDRKNKQLANLTNEELTEIMKSLKEAMEKSGSFKNSVVRNQRTSKKLVLDMTNANAKVTLLFCTPVSLKRSFLIRTYRRLEDRLQQLTYLFTILTQNNPDLALLTNNPLCHLLIYYLQVYGYIEVLHEKIPKEMTEVDIFALVDIEEDRLSEFRNKQQADIPVSLLVYECAEFYSRFNYNYAIDVAVDAVKKRKTYSNFKKYANDPMFIPCAYSDSNIASGVTRQCFGAFIKMMENIKDKFVEAKESELFESNLLELAKNAGSVPVI